MEDKNKKEEIFRNGKENGTITEYDTLGNIITKGDYVYGLHAPGTHGSRRDPPTLVRDARQWA